MFYAAADDDGSVDSLDRLALGGGGAAKTPTKREAGGAAGRSPESPASTVETSTLDLSFFDDGDVPQQQQQPQQRRKFAAGLRDSLAKRRSSTATAKKGKGGGGGGSQRRHSTSSQDDNDRGSGKGRGSYDLSDVGGESVNNIIVTTINNNNDGDGARPTSRSGSRGRSRSSSRDRSRTATTATTTAATKTRKSRSRSRSILRTFGSTRNNRGRREGDGSLDPAEDDNDDDDDDEAAEEDPLVDLFETHNRRRVMFDPTFAPPPPSSPSKLTRSSNSFNIKGFMNRIIVKGGKESAGEVVDDDEISSAMAMDAATAPPLVGMTDAAPAATTTSTTAVRPSSALRSGRRGTGKFVSPPPTTTSDPYLIDRAKSRSLTTAAVANAAFSRSTRFHESVPAESAGAPGGAAKFSYRNFRQRGGGDAGAPMADSNRGQPFQEDPQVTKRIERLLGRANRAHTRTYRYEHAIGYYLAALEMLTKEGYPESHELVSRAVRKLNDCHHAQSSLKNSANIVKMGIKHENRGEFVRALKMYTIAYRIRRDALSKFHPSLPVLLNMLGSGKSKVCQ